MKQTTLVIILFLITLSSMHAQLYTVPSCSTLGATTYGPMYSTSSANSTNRTAVIYPASQLSGIVGKVVSGMYFNRTTSGVEMIGTPNFKIYVKETAAVDFGAGALDWATATTGATLVYDSNPAPIVGLEAGWKSFPLLATFTYSGTQNLAVFFEYKNTTSSSALSWSYEYGTPCIATSNLNTTKYSNNTTGTLPTSLASSDYRRPAIGFDYLVACNAPHSIVASDITATTANISWASFSTYPSGGFEYFLSTENVPPLVNGTPTGTVSVGNSVNLPSLLPNTQYYIWIRANCGVVDGVSLFSAGSFKTTCTSVTQYTMNFEGETTGAGNLPACWSRAGSSANVYTTTGSVAPMSTVNRLYMNITASNEAYAILPPFSNIQANTHRLKFKAYAGTANKVLQVGYFTNSPDVSTFVSIEDLQLPGTAATTALELYVTPNNVPAGVSQLVLKPVPGTAYTVYMDDFVWEQIPSCVEVSDVSATLITQNTAQINWTNGGAETNWDIQYGVSGFTLGTGTIVSNVATNPYVLTTLSSNTNYQYYIRASCSVSDQSSWVGPYSFKTLCDTVTEYLVNFEGLPTGTGNLPDCWSTLGTSTSVYVAASSVAPMSPPNRLFMSITASTTAFALMNPVSNLQANTHRLKFKGYSSTANKTMSIGYLTNPTDETTYVELQLFTLPGTAASTAQEYVLIPTNVPAGVTQLVVSLPAGIATTIYLDDIKWEINSSCVEPSQLTANQITNTSAQLGWVNGGPETAWEIQYGLQNFPLGTGTIVSNVATNPYVLNGLLGNTTYQYYVRGVCTGPINSAWTGPFTFKTQCNEATEFTEVFEGYPTGNSNPLADCWTKGGTLTNVYITTGSVAPMSPTLRLYMTASGSATPPTESYAIMPPVSNLQANTHRLKFKAYSSSGTDRTLDVGYLTDLSNVNTFVSLEQIVLPGTAASSASEFIIIPGALPAGVKHLAIRNSGIPTGATIAYLDDFAWEAIPSCLETSGLTVIATTNESAELGWTENGSATAWEIEFGAPGFVQGTGTIVPAPSNPFTLTGLIENTNYVFYVRAVCSVSNSSPWAGPLAFKTKCNVATEFTQVFEGYATGTTAPMPDCWSRGGNGATYITTGSVAPMSPTLRLQMVASGTEAAPTQAYAIMPVVSNLQANSHRLKFKAYATAADRFLEVGYLTDPSDVATFQVIQEVNLPGTTAANAIEFTVTPGALPMDAKCLAIKNSGYPGSSTTAYLDDFKWEAIPSCLEPSNLFASQISANAAVLSWNTSGSNETVWDIEYGAPGFTQGTGTLVSGVTSNPYTLGSLTEDTSYQFYIRAVCSVSDASVWIGPHTFRTLCTSVTEYTMDFVGQTTGAGNLPACWSRAGTSTNVYTTTGSVAPMSPSNRLYMNITSLNVAYAILPPFSNIQANTHRLKFKAYAATANKVLQVGYFTNAPDVSTFVALEDIQLPGTAAATALEFIVVPNGVPAGVSQLVLKPVPGTAYTVYLDDFVWEAIPTTIPTCASNIVATPNATCGNFATTFAWDATPGADGYKMKMGTTPGGSEVLNNVNIGSNPSYSFLGNINTTYYYTVTPFNAAGDAIGCVEQTFTTAVNGCVCSPLYVTGVGSNDMMSNIVITGTTLANNTGNSTTAPPYNYYTGQPNYTATLVEGTTYDVAVTVGSGGSQGVAIWIDLNDNLTYEASEKIGFTATNIAASSTGTIQILIPCNAPVGLHRMRIRNVFNASGSTIDPCSSYTYGEVEDYDVTIAELAPPTGDAVQAITADTAADATIEDLVVVGTGVKWFASEADALANSNQLPAGSLITDGTIYYAVSSAGTCNSAALAVTANVTLSVGGFDNASFNYYPNPATDVLTVSYSNVISEVVIYNLLGQQVLAVQPNATQSQMDVSGLTAGTYLVKVTSDEVSKTIKVVKN